MTRRACCKAEEAAGCGRAPVIDDMTFARIVDGEHARNVIEPRRDAAVHELGHGLAAILVHAPVDRIFCGGALVDTDALSADDLAFAALAGPVAEMFVEHSIRRRFDNEWLEFVGRVRAGVGGNCDECRACRAFLAEAPNADDAELIERLRAAEGRAIETITSEKGWRVWSLILEAADLLMRKGEITGAQFAQIILDGMK
jgi:hypothetical protein